MDRFTGDRQSLLQVEDLGRMAYEQAFERQQTLHAQVARGESPSVLLLVEHDPVITLSQRRNVREHLLADDARLAALGIHVAQTDRGGDITYHGPGQLVAYPILRLADYRLNLSRYMRLLEQGVIDTLAAFALEGQRDPGATGVWVATGQDMGSLAKIAALGVRIRRNTTLHGLALNVSTDLSHFQTIVRCGLADRAVTSMQALLGASCPDMAKVRERLVHVFQQALAERVQGGPEKA